jgi:hypothetical protein
MNTIFKNNVENMETSWATISLSRRKAKGKCTGLIRFSTENYKTARTSDGPVSPRILQKLMI